MKTERRHELQQNSLADALAEWIEVVKPYSTAILGAIIAGLVLIGVALYLSQQAEQQQEVAWDQVFVRPQANPATPEDERLRLQRDRYLNVAEQFGDSPAGLYARLMAADGLLNTGISNLFQDKAKGTDELRQSIEHYKNVLANSGEPLFTHEATLGLARAHESLGELKEAREQYQKLVDQKGIYSQMAEGRLKDLERKSTKDFYDWFAQQQPRPRASSLPGIPGLGPEFNLDGASSTPFGDLNLSSPFSPATTTGSDKAGEEKAASPGAADKVDVEKAGRDKAGADSTSTEKPATP